MTRYSIWREYSNYNAQLVAMNLILTSFHNFSGVYVIMIYFYYVFYSGLKCVPHIAL